MDPFLERFWVFVGGGADPVSEVEDGLHGQRSPREQGLEPGQGDGAQALDPCDRRDPVQRGFVEVDVEDGLRGQRRQVGLRSASSRSAGNAVARDGAPRRGRLFWGSRCSNSSWRRSAGRASHRTRWPAPRPRSRRGGGARGSRRPGSRWPRPRPRHRPRPGRSPCAARTRRSATRTRSAAGVRPRHVPRAARGRPR